MKLVKFNTSMPAGLAERYAAARRQTLVNGTLFGELRAASIQVVGRTFLNLAAGGGEWDVALLQSGARQVIWLDSCPEMLRHAMALHVQYNVRSSYIRANMECVPL